MKPQEIGAAIGGLLLVVMQVANIVSTGKVDSAVEQSHRELSQDTDAIAREARDQTEILRILKEAQKTQLENSQVYFRKLDELKALQQAQH